MEARLAGAVSAGGPKVTDHRRSPEVCRTRDALSRTGVHSRRSAVAACQFSARLDWWLRHQLANQVKTRLRLLIRVFTT
jgi:hypothetical protein